MTTTGSENEKRDEPLFPGSIEEVGPSSASLLQQLAQILWVFKAEYELEFGVSPLIIRVLALISQYEGLTQVELTNLARVDASMITRILKEIEQKHEWIRRERDKADNRLLHVYLTAAGREQISNVTERMKIVEQRLTGGLDEGEVQMLRQLLFKLEQTYQVGKQELQAFSTKS